MFASSHLSSARRHLQWVRHRVLARLPRSRAGLLFLLLLGSAAVLVVLSHIPTAFTTLQTMHLRAFRPYTPRLLSSSFFPPALLPLSYPNTDIDRPPSIRKYFEDALTLHADHSSVYSPARYPELDWAAVAEDDDEWSDDDGEERLLGQIEAHAAAISASPSAAAAYRHALLTSLLHYQFHPDTPYCASTTRYLVYPFSSEFTAVSEACMSTHRQQALQKPPHRNLNKVSSVREIIEQMEKTAKLREKLQQGTRDEREETSVEGLTDECRLDVLLDVVRALLVAQASGRELVLLPVQHELCTSPMGEAAGTASATWVGCVWPELLVRPSRCGWSDVKASQSPHHSHVKSGLSSAAPLLTPPRLYALLSPPSCAVSSRR